MKQEPITGARNAPEGVPAEDVGATAVDPADLELLLARYTPGTGDESRRPPWTWPVLNPDERAALACMIDAFVAGYNHVHALGKDDLIPPCWRRHPALATELAVQVWLHYAAHHGTTATPAIAGDYYLRHLPGFQARLGRLLGSSPKECRRGAHYDNWRRETAELEATYRDQHDDNARDQHDIDLLGRLHFGFPQVV